jgi:hypothetical protein
MTTMSSTSAPAELDALIQTGATRPPGGVTMLRTFPTSARLPTDRVMTPRRDDRRSSRRGVLTLSVGTRADVAKVRNIVTPPGGLVAPVWINASSSAGALVDDMVIIPLDVEWELASQEQPNQRFCMISFVEVDPTLAFTARTGDNDDLTAAPRASFTVSDATPQRGQRVTFTPTSTGQVTEWRWDFDGDPGYTSYGSGAAQSRVWTSTGRKRIRHAVKNTVTGETSPWAVKYITVGR